MTRNDPDIEPDMLPAQSNLFNYESVSLSVASLIATIGLIGYAAARLPAFPIEVAIPHLLALSVLAFGVGAGAFALLFNYYLTLVVTKARMLKVASVYALVLGLLVPVVDAGAFHPRLAMVFICLLAGGAVVHSLFRQRRVSVASERRA